MPRGANLTYRRCLRPIAVFFFGVMVLTGPGLRAAADEAFTNAQLDAERLDPDEQRELDHLLDDLRDTRLDLDRRRRAAAILLDHNWPAAVSTLKQLLSHSPDATTRRAIARAIAGADAPDPQLIDPLVKMLGSDDADLRRDVSAGLSHFADPALVANLIKIADSNKAPLNERLGAVAALAEHRQPRVVEALLTHIHARQPALRDAAFDALEQLTGIADYGHDTAEWHRWWSRVNTLPQAQWEAMIMRHLSARNVDLDKQLSRRTARLTQTYNNLYDATDEKGRATILQQMMVDDLIELRMLSLGLIERRVLNAQPISDDVRAAMRGRLLDRDPEVRAKVASLLENVADEAAAEQVVELLLAEGDPRVQSAYLALLARVPQVEAVNSALLLLDRPTVRGSAATFLVAAAEAKMLSDQQARRALAFARVNLKDADPPEPAVVRLLGRLGESSDQPMLEKLLTHTEPTVRLAAAEVFADPRWPLAPLTERISDPALRPAVVAAIGARGADVASLIKLIDAPPKDTEQRANWLAAILAVAARLDAPGVVRIDQYLAAATNLDDIHEQILKAAAAPPPADATTPTAEARSDEATFRLAGFYARSDQPARAKPLYERLAARTTLSTDDQRRLVDATLRLMLIQKLYDDAERYTTTQLTAAPPAPLDLLADTWLDLAEQSIAANDKTAAGLLTDRAARLFAKKLSNTDAARLTDLQTQLAPPDPIKPTSTRNSNTPAAPQTAPVTIVKP